MESSSVLENDNDGARMSDSLRRSPYITSGLENPVRSVHPDMIESLNSQADFGHRTVDLFDDTSEDEGTDPGSVAPDIDLLARRGSATKKRQSGPISAPLAPFVSQCEGRTPRGLTDRDGYQRLSHPAELSQHPQYAESAISSFGGSVDEMLPGQHMNPPAMSAREHYSSPPQMPRQAHINNGQPLRSSTVLDRPDSQQSRMLSSKVEQILGAHAIAHEITLQALMRDDNTLDQGFQSFAPMRGNERKPLLPSGLRFNDPRSPRGQDSVPPVPSDSGRKVYVVPPPIDTTAPQREFPVNMVRTSYPFEASRRKIFDKTPGATPSITTPAPSNAESILTLSIRRTNPNSKLRVTTLTLPPRNDYVATRDSENPYPNTDPPNHTRTRPKATSTQHLHRQGYDDETFFHALRHAYTELLGAPLHYLPLARTLSRISVSGPATRAADSGYGWLHQPRSPRALASSGLSDSLSESKILQAFRRPALGRRRFAFVGWARRLAAAGPRPGVGRRDRGAGGEDCIGCARDVESVFKNERPEGLEFVLAWSVKRILVAVGLVLGLSVAAVLLWSFLRRSGGGGAGDRVATGLVLGICVLLMGLTGIGGWLGISWLVL